MAKADYDFVPKTYEELYRHYVRPDQSGRSIVASLMRSFVRYATEEEMTNLVQDVFARCLDKKILERFDPSKANFGGIIFTVVRTVGVNFLARKSRDPMGGLYGGSLVEQEDDETWTPGTYHLTRFVAPQTDTETRMIHKQLVERLFRIASEAALHPRNTRDRNLLTLLGLLYEEYTPKECAEQLGVSQTTVGNWTRYLASFLSPKGKSST